MCLRRPQRHLIGPDILANVDNAMRVTLLKFSQAFTVLPRRDLVLDLQVTTVKVPGFSTNNVATAYHVSIIWVTDYNEYSQNIYTVNSVYYA